MTEFKYLKFKPNKSFGLLTIDNESALNALNPEILTELRSFFEENRHLSGLVITGAGEKSFVAGADIKSMQGLSQDEARSFAYLGQQVTCLMEEQPYPLIAAVNGFALGGGLELALACDFIFATENALFGLPEVTLGLIPGFGGTQRLARQIGLGKARKLIYSAEKIKIAQAINNGLVLESFNSKDEMISKCFDYLERVAKNSSLAVGVAKSSINQGYDISLEEGLKIEQSHFANLFNSFDTHEGIEAFIEKRTANFKGE